jgi:uncharacterized membrane protein YeaQ/YmgE (transglycosylase-associated protein family)
MTAGTAVEPGEGPDRTVHRPPADAAADAAWVLGILLALGVVCGLLWWLLVDPATFTKLKTGGAMGEVQLAKQFNADGWYAVLAAVAGLLAGGLLTWWRGRDFLLTVVLLAVGSALAAAVMALTGHLLGPGDPQAALVHAKLGATVPADLRVTAKADYLVWPIAVLIGSLMVLWSPPKDTAA